VVPVHSCMDVHAEPKSSSDIGVVVERDLVAAEGEAVNIGPIDGDGGKRLDEGAAVERSEAVARVGVDTHGGRIERAREAKGSARVDLHEMHIHKGVHEQPASKIRGVAADLAALIIEGSSDGVVIEVGVDEVAESPEDQDIVLRQESSLAEIDAGLEVDGLEVAVKIVFVAAAIGRHAFAVLTV
jgi:hypothetical protein